MQRILFLLLGLFLITPCVLGQGRITGTITEQDGPVVGANILVQNIGIGTASDENGAYRINVPANVKLFLVISHINYQEFRDTVSVANGQELVLDVELIRNVNVLNPVQITGDQEEDAREQVSIFEIEPQAIKTLPTPFGDFSSVLFTLPGVVGNNELSSTYSVRGGNFDENLVYVNDIPIYRPLLISSGQQEGLSFINVDLVESVSFSAGGWQPKYGDKLSSSLNVNYKEPKEFAATATLGLLGGSLHAEGRVGRASFLAGVRHKNSRYLLNTFDTDGQYLPKFTDVQSLVTLPIGDKGTELSLLGSYARNEYFVEPQSRETEFGAFGFGAFRLFVAFLGAEQSEYETLQAGLKLKHRFGQKLYSDFIVSAVQSQELEMSDVEGAYRLCDVDNDPSSASFNDCVFVRGIGTNFNFKRNELDVQLLNVENRSIWALNGTTSIEFGVGYNRQSIDDTLDEFAFVDSADFVTITENVSSDNDIQSNQYTAYLQAGHTLARTTLTYGARLNYWDFNEQLLFSPRAQISYRPGGNRDIVLRGAVGLYQQPPFFRELRDFSGQLNRDLKAQSAVHLIAGLDYNFQIWNRNFKFLAEGYYKYLYNVVPYDIDNVRIRYYATNAAKAYAVGADFRINGEFVPGTESWFSLGILSTREDFEEDSRGYISRPTDQRLNLGIVFQDYFPGDPTLRVNLGLLLGTGFPFGPPNNIDSRTIFGGEEYTRVDVGFSKVFNFQPSSQLKSLWLGLEILNLLGASNPISFIWIEDFSNNQFAVPNNLSARFLNLKLIGRF